MKALNKRRTVVTKRSATVTTFTVVNIYYKNNKDNILNIFKGPRKGVWTEAANKERLSQAGIQPLPPPDRRAFGAQSSLTPLFSCFIAERLGHCLCSLSQSEKNLSPQLLSFFNGV